MVECQKVPSVAINRTSSFLSTPLIFCFTSSTCSVCWSFGGVLVVVKHGWEVRSHSHGGLYRGLRVGVAIALVSLAILPRGDFLEGAGQSLASRLSILRLMVGLLSGIFVRTGLDVRSL